MPSESVLTASRLEPRRNIDANRRRSRASAATDTLRHPLVTPVVTPDKNLRPSRTSTRWIRRLRRSVRATQSPRVYRTESVMAVSRRRDERRRAARTASVSTTDVWTAVMTPRRLFTHVFRRHDGALDIPHRNLQKYGGIRSREAREGPTEPRVGAYARRHVTWRNMTRRKCRRVVDAFVRKFSYGKGDYVRARH